jgi:hypothetical protein
MVPRPEIAHWLTASVCLLVGLLLLSEAIVGTAVFRRRLWRAYLWPSLALGGGVLLWVIVVFSTFSAMHLLAHAVWAQAAMVVGAVQLASSAEAHEPALVTRPASALFLSESRSSSTNKSPLFPFGLHPTIGWIVVVAATPPLGGRCAHAHRLVARPRARTFVVVAVLSSPIGTSPIFVPSDAAVR